MLPRRGTFVRSTQNSCGHVSSLLARLPRKKINPEKTLFGDRAAHARLVRPPEPRIVHVHRPDIGKSDTERMKRVFAGLRTTACWMTPPRSPMSGTVAKGRIGGQAVLDTHPISWSFCALALGMWSRSATASTGLS
jgi:hypothetical protein